MRISSKLPPTNPAYAPTLSITDKNLHYLASLASGTDPSYLTLSGGTKDVDGKRFGVYLAGRATIYNGATPGTLTVGVYQGKSVHIPVSVPLLNIPVNQSGLICPFWVRLELVYDGKNNSLSGMQYNQFYYSPANFTRGMSNMAEYMNVLPGNLSFTAGFQFNNFTPLAGTVIETTEFVL